MILKPRTKPLELERLEAVQRRLHPTHPRIEDIESELNRQQAGYNGESAIDYYLTFLPSEHYTLYHNLRLHDGRHFFQIDTLLITPHVLIILEIKNISGRLIFNSFSQLERETSEEARAFDNPIDQLRRQQTQLTQFLKEHTGESFPVDGLVVMANKNAPMKVVDNPNFDKSKICTRTALVDRIQKLEKSYAHHQIPAKWLASLSPLLLKRHQELDRDILNRHHLTYDEIIKGVQCLKCLNFDMQRLKQRWQCPRCAHVSRDAHHQALADYNLLISPRITNQEGRAFLKVSSRYVTKRLLQGYAVAQKGKQSGLKYILR